MMITVHLSDGRKITKDAEKLDFFSTRVPSITGFALPKMVEGRIAINVEQIIDMRPAEEDEIKHAEIHGW